MSFGHHLLSGLQTAFDQHAAVDRLAGSHGPQFDILFVCDHPDEVAARTMAQRCRRHRDAGLALIVWAGLATAVPADVIVVPNALASVEGNAGIVQGLSDGIERLAGAAKDGDAALPVG